jgi:hypothetical protein
VVLILILRQSSSVSDNSTKFLNGISRLERRLVQRIADLEQKNKILEDQNNVSCHYDRVICSPMLCEWLLHCSCVVTMIQLYVAQFNVSGYYIVHLS